MVHTSHIVRVAAVQIPGRVGDLAYNLQQAETLASEALAKGARIVTLPQFFTTPCAVDPRVTDAIVDTENPAKQLLVRLAAGLRATYAVRKGDRVGPLARNSTDHFEHEFACRQGIASYKVPKSVVFVDSLPTGVPS